jgi:hypothetical protein
MTTSTSAVKIQFSFENEVGVKNIAAIEKKVATLRNNLDIDTTMNIFSERYSIEVILTFDSNYSRRESSQLQTLLNRLINSHNQPATYGWSTASQLVGA